MTRNSSLREFAKRERANSWQAKGKFAFKFVDTSLALSMTNLDESLNFDSLPRYHFIKARNDSGLCHFEPCEPLSSP